jgi:uncharacterized protein YtpQ (UPF0354 family)
MNVIKIKKMKKILNKIFGKKENVEKEVKKKVEEENKQIDVKKSTENLKLSEIIYPAIKRADDGRIISSNQENPIITKKFIEDLVIVYNLDFGDRFEMLSNSRLNEINLPIDVIHQHAINNLRKKATNNIGYMDIDPPEEIKGGKSFQRIMLDNNFDPSLMLLDELWPQFSKNLNDKLVGVCIPAKNILAISTFSDDNISYRTMRILAKQTYEASKSENIELTNESYVWKEGRFIKFLDTEEQNMKEFFE